MDSDHIKMELEKKLAALESRLGHLQSDQKRRGEGLEADFEEQAAVRENDEVVDDLEAAARLEIEQIRGALQRLENGTYGVCVTCEAAIPPRRLEVLPYTNHCIECAEG